MLVRLSLGKKNKSIGTKFILILWNQILNDLEFKKNFFAKVHSLDSQIVTFLFMFQQRAHNNACFKIISK